MSTKRKLQKTMRKMTKFWRNLWKTSLTCGADSISSEDFAECCECWEADEHAFLAETVDCTPPWFNKQTTAVDQEVSLHIPSPVTKNKTVAPALKKFKNVNLSATGVDEFKLHLKDGSSPKNKTKLTLVDKQGPPHMTSSSVQKPPYESLQVPWSIDPRDLLYKQNSQGVNNVSLPIDELYNEGCNAVVEIDLHNNDDGRWETNEDELSKRHVGQKAGPRENTGL